MVVKLLNVPHFCRNDSSQSAICPLLFIGHIVLLEWSFYYISTYQFEIKTKTFRFKAAAATRHHTEKAGGSHSWVCAPHPRFK